MAIAPPFPHERRRGWAPSHKRRRSERAHMILEDIISILAAPLPRIGSGPESNAESRTRRDRVVAERYLRLGLQLGRHVEGIVDAYIGPPELAAAVDGRAAGRAADARRRLRRRLLDELEDGWLRDQVVGPAHLRRRAGGRVQARTPTRWRGATACGRSTPTRRSSAPRTSGSRSCSPATDRWPSATSAGRASILVPTGQVERTVPAVIEEARDVDARPGRAPGRRRRRPGDRARRAVAGVLRLPRRPAQPGRRQRRPPDVGHRAAPARDPRDLPRPPHGALPARSTARARPGAARGDAGARAHTAVARLGGDRRRSRRPWCSTATAGRARRGHAPGRHRGRSRARRGRRAGRRAAAGGPTVNAALLLHDDGAGEAEVQAYLERWGLMTPQLAAHMIRFFKEPTSRTYIITYPAGRELCRSYVGGDRSASAGC